MSARERKVVRIFVEWENFLEATFLRMMCGYESSVYIPSFAAGKKRQGTLVAAQSQLFGPRDYLLWHNPRAIQGRGQDWFVGGPHEVVTASNFTRLEWFASVRHRVAHGSEDARRKLDTATINLNGRRYRGSSAGRFLRDWDHSVSPSLRWLNSIGDELAGLAAQISP